MWSNGEDNVVKSMLKDWHTAQMWAKKLRSESKQIELEQTHLLVVFLEEVQLFFQAVQISPQGGDDLLVVGLGLFQSNTVSLHRLTHHQLSLPPGLFQINKGISCLFTFFFNGNS